MHGKENSTPLWDKPISGMGRLGRTQTPENEKEVEGRKIMELAGFPRKKISRLNRQQKAGLRNSFRWADNNCALHSGSGKSSLRSSDSLDPVPGYFCTAIIPWKTVAPLMEFTTYHPRRALKCVSKEPGEPQMLTPLNKGSQSVNTGSSISIQNSFILLMEEGAEE